MIKNPKGLAILIVILGLTSCTYYADEPMQTQPPEFPIGQYEDQDQNNIFIVQSQLSQITLYVRRGGLMAALGHDHIVASQDLQGFILFDQNLGQCTADFFVSLALLEVDNPKLRSIAGMTTTPSDNDIAGTRNNMLLSTEASQFPFAQLHSADCSDVFTKNSAQVTFKIHGVEQRQTIQVDWQQTADGRLIASGTFSLLQTDFGIEPFSIMNGLIKVEDRLDFSFKIQGLNR